MSQTPAPTPAPANPPTAPAPQPAAPERKSSAGKLLLYVTGGLFIAWMAWLSYTALTKTRDPIVSRAQAAAATVPVVAEITTADADRQLVVERPGGIQGKLTAPLKEQVGKPAVIVKVVELIQPNNGPPVGSEIAVSNLPTATGFTGPGQYLLLLNRDGEATVNAQGSPPRDAYLLAGQQRSPGADLGGVGSPMIYRWGPDVRAQTQRLFSAKD